MSEPANAEVAFEYVFEQEVRAARVDRYYALSDRLRELASRQPGFLTQERQLVEKAGDVWRFRTVLKFDTAEHCVTWLDNPERRRLLNLEEEEAGFSFRGHGNWEGYSRWLSRRITSEPPKWKVNLLVLLTLYPTVMVLTPLLHLAFGGWSMPSVMLISNTLCVAATSWVLVPFASRFTLDWLEGKSERGWLTLICLLGVLAALWLIFHSLPPAVWG